MVSGYWMLMAYKKSFRACVSGGSTAYFLDQIDFAMHDDLKLRAVDSSRGAAIVGA